MPGARAFAFHHSKLRFFFSAAQAGDQPFGRASEQIVHSLGVDVGEYFESLDHQLDTVYSYPSVLANLNTGSPEKAEMPARALMTQTSFFRYLSSIAFTIDRIP